MGSQSSRQVSRLRQVRWGLSSVFALALLLGSSAIPAKAQTYLQSIGVPTFTTKLPVENGFINAANGSLHLEIPFGSFPQRGGPPDKIVLMYDSAIWTWYGGSWSPDNISVYTGLVPDTQSSIERSAGGWRVVTSREPGYLSYGQTFSGYCAPDNSSMWRTMSPWIWTAPDGTQHSFKALTEAPVAPSSCNGTGIPSSSAYATDGSGFYISITNYTNAVVYAPDGTQVIGDAFPDEDTNGNYIVMNHTWNSSTNVDTWTYTDTLGRTIMTAQNNRSSNVYTFAVLNPQGTTSTYTVLTQTINVDTNFSLYNNYSNVITVVSEIDLPDGTKYYFGYDSGTTPGYYGLLNSMTLPTGGQIGYSFSNFTDSYGNPSRWVSGRTTADGTWTYALQVLSSCPNAGCQQKYMVTKPSTDQTGYTFTLNGGAWPTQVQYNDHVAGVLATTNLCFSFVPLNTNDTCSYSTMAPATNVHLLATTTTLPIPSGNVTATTQYSWDNNNQGIYGELIQTQEWNFGNAPPSAADRTTAMTYYTPGGNILNRPSNITVTNNVGATVAQTLYTYDVYTYNGGSLASMTGMLGHDDTNYGTNNTTRGNVTLVQKLVGGSTYLNSYTNFDMTGQVTASYDPSLQKTSYGYACQNAYQATITNALNQITTRGYDCNTGLLTSIKDANNETTSFSYDDMARPLTTSYPDSGQTALAYNYSGSTYTGSTTTKKVTSSQNLVTTNSTDGRGRVTTSVTTSDPDGATTVTTAFDTNGRVSNVSNPHRSTPESTDGSETYAYDGLDRVIQTTHADGHVSSIYYGTAVAGAGGAGSQLCTPSGIAYPILKIDEAGNKLQSWIDAFGRTVEADEPTATSSSLTANTCYSYDLNKNLTGVLAAGGLQTRTFVYDALSRQISATNPESGQTTYTYDVDTNCPSPNSFPGDQVSRVDARGVRTCMQYDALHRLVTKTYTDGTPTAYFRYDQTSNWGLTLTNPIGRLTEEYTDTTKPWSASLFGYDPMGRVVLNNQCTPASCGTSNSPVNYTYDFLGNMATYTNGAGVTITQSPFSGAGRLTQVTSSLADSNHPGMLLSNVKYNALGEMASATLGNGATETLGYAPRGWPQSATVLSSALVSSPATPGKGTVTINGSESSHTQSSYSASQGPNTASAAQSDYSVGVAWVNPSGAYSDNPNNAAGASQSLCCYHSTTTDYLDVSGFGFSIPSNATITGVVVTVSHWGPAYASTVTDSIIEIFKGGTSGTFGSNHSNSTWPNVGGFKTVTYGSSSDNWGLSLGPSDLNASNFGVRISANMTWDSVKGGGTASAEVDYVTATAYYTMPAVTTYDAGNVTVTVNGTSTQPAYYGNGSTGVSIAGQLAGYINSFGFVTASNNNTNVITIQSTTNGSSTNYSLSPSSQSNYPQWFNPPSFTTGCNGNSPCPPGSTLTGGTDDLVHPTLYSFSLGYGAGNADVTSANDTVNGNWVFTYDYLNRVSTSNQNNQNAFSYGYDQLGNRTSQTVTAGSGGTLNLSYSCNCNRMDGYSYDAAGNLLGDGLHNYAYDAENRLVSVDGGTTASYVYDAEGRRVQKTAGAQVEYLYDLNGNIVTELSSSGAWNRGEIFANGQHLATYSGGSTGTTYFDHADRLGTERARSDITSNNCETITNVPFGDSQSMSGACADVSPLHFTGQQWDSETTSLDYFKARHYSSQFGRFVSPDPENISGILNQDDPQSWNGYAYVRNNPLSLTDPSGTNWSVCDIERACGTLDQQQFNQFLANSPDITMTASGSLYAGDTLIGSASYFNENVGFTLQQAGFMSQTGLNWSMLVTAPNFAVVGLAHLFLGGGALTTLGLSPTAISASGPLAYAASQLSKPDALQALQTLGGTPQQIEAAKSFIQRATATSEITIEKFSDGVLRVTIDRAGADGSMSMVRIINTSGMSNLYQRAVNAAGELVHLDPKNP